MKFSFEFFPPHDEVSLDKLMISAQELSVAAPDFVSVTCGAGGETRRLTAQALEKLLSALTLRCAAHLTCVGLSRQDTHALVEAYNAMGVNDVVALRGDPPRGQEGFKAMSEGFATSVELISSLRERGGVNIITSAYPEPHPEATDVDSDIRWLLRKQEAGATSALTQFFFEAETFLRFRDRCEKFGVSIPVAPGILPVQSWAGAQRFALRCGAKIPAGVEERFNKAGLEGEASLGVEMCSELCSRLMSEGVEHLHFYTLNKAEPVLRVVDNITQMSYQSRSPGR